MMYANSNSTSGAAGGGAEEGHAGNALQRASPALVLACILL